MSTDTLGSRVRSRRKALGLTLDALAAKAGMSKGFLSDLERDRRGIGADSLLSLGRSLGVSLDWLMLGDSASAAARWDASVPTPLADLAAAEDLSYRTVAVLLALHRVIAVHRREKAGAGFDWAKFYGKVKEFI